ncbi:hypothetical protein [Photobacterium sp. GB-1]|uniref:hypothetical protein n=1 Tax=Photobacterium sp. GB-1 TaxID=2022111 RepID=UPI001E2A94BF|nr:hypothetical protein [Photobacterium sp. GB-1]
MGKLVNQNKSQLIVEAAVYDAENREIGRGSGVFVHSKQQLVDVNGYGLYVASRS